MEQYNAKNTPKRASIYIVIPAIQDMSYSYVSHARKGLLEPPFTINQMPPYSMLELIKENIIHSGHELVKFSFGVLDLEGVNYLLYLHEMKVKQESYLSETSWFEILDKPPSNSIIIKKKGKKLVRGNSQALLPPVIDPLNTDVIVKYKNALYTLPDASILPLPYLENNINVHATKLTVGDAATLACDRHLAGSVISRFVYILMSCQQDVVVVYLNNISDMLDFGRKSREQYGPNICKFIFILNVLCEKDSVQIANAGIQGNHYSYCIIEIINGDIKIQYFDTLRHIFPREVRDEYIPTFLFGYFSDVSVHQFNITCQPLNHSFCYPIQDRIGPLCGPVTIVGVSLAVLRPDLFINFTSTKSNVAPSIRYLAYLLDNDVDRLSILLRFAMIEWLYTGSINLRNILKSVSREETFSLSNPLMESSAESFSDQVTTPDFERAQKKIECVHKLKEGQRKFELQVPDNVLSLLEEWPQIFKRFSNSKLKSPFFKLKCLLKGSRDTKTRNFDICPDDEAPLFEKTVSVINSFLYSKKCIAWLESSHSNDSAKEPVDLPDTANVSKISELFTKPPRIDFAKPCNLRVKCFLKGDVVISKRFPCTEQKKNDAVAQKKIQDYLSSTEALQQALQKLSGNKDWVEVCDLSVGSQTKWYFDDFKFDVRTVVDIKKKFVRPVNNYGESSLKATIAESKKGKNTHRFDDSYEYNDIDKPSKQFPVITKTIICASKSSACKSACGSLLSQLDLKNVSTVCPSCKEPLTESGVMRCENCQALNSARWLILNNKTVCCTCFRYHQKYGCLRPENLYRKPSRHKLFYHSHFQCHWKIKLILYSTNLKSWKVFSHKDNSKSHSIEAIQVKKRVNLSTRDEWDFQSVYHNTPPSKMFPSEGQGSSLRVPYSQKQYYYRTRVIKKKLFQASFKKSDVNPINSNWRKAEKILESKLDSVLLFHRENNQNGNEYMIVLSNDRLCEGLRDFGTSVLYYDTKHDILSMPFSTSLLTFADGNNCGRSAVLGICNKENKISHCKVIQIAIANIPCENESCPHQRQLYILNDKSGFFFIRPCAQDKTFNPMVQHDLIMSTRNAAVELGLQTALGHFYSLRAYRKHLSEGENQLKFFIRPLETAFKCILCSWNPQSRHHMTSRLMTFVNDVIPSDLLPKAVKEKFLSYLSSKWFSQEWMSTFTAEVIYGANQIERKDRYFLLTNCLTETKFSDVGKCVLDGNADNLMASFLSLAMNKFMCPEGTESESSRTEWNGSRTVKVQNINEELNRIKRGCQIVKDHKIFVSDGGWTIVLKTINGSNKNSSNVPEEYFLECCDQHVTDQVCDYLDVYLRPRCNLKAMAQQMISGENLNIITTCKTLLQDLDQTAAGIFLSAVLNSVPERIKLLYQMNPGFLCNLDIGICTCYSFVIHGQPYFCEHLYACLSLKEGSLQPDVILELYKGFVPTYEFEVPPVATSTTNDPFYHINGLLQQSHLATSEEFDEASNNGKILTLLHDANSPQICSPTGTDNKSILKGCHQRKGGKSKKSEKPLPPDPYRPSVEFPSDLAASHIGCKHTSHESQSLNFQQVVHNALDVLRVKRTKNYSSNSSSDNDHFEITDFLDTFVENEECVIATINDTKKMDRKPRTKSHEELVPMLCSHCASTSNPCAVFYSEKDLQDHIKQCHTVQPITCSECYRLHHMLHTFPSKKEYYHHFKAFHSSAQPSSSTWSASSGAPVSQLNFLQFGMGSQHTFH